MPLIDWDQSRQQFIAGKIGIFFDTPARLRQVTDLIGDKFTLGTAIFPIDDKAKGGAADRRQRGDHHHARSGEAEGGVGVPEVRHRPRGAEDRRRDDRLPADEPARAGAGVPRPVLRREPELPDRDPRRSSARRRGRAIRAATRCASGARSARSSTRVMRGTTSPQEGLDKLVAETTALMK